MATLVADSGHRSEAVAMEVRDVIRERMHRVIFESDTPAGRLFDIVLMVLIVASVGVVVLDRVNLHAQRYPVVLTRLEWVFTGLFTLEYLARLYRARNRRHYAFSLFGVIDLIAILPTYLALLVPQLHALLYIRMLRLLRIFRVLKLTEYVTE